MNRVIMICPYFGSLPDTVDATVYSLSRNTFIDWTIVTDQVISADYENVRVIAETMDSFRKKVSDTLGVTFDSPYKLCDFKPLYGIIFKDLIRGYDYWGYFDLDAIYGKIDAFLDLDRLCDYAKLFTLGHFSLYRGDVDVRGLVTEGGELIPPVKAMLESSGICVFDEPYCLMERDGIRYDINSILERGGLSIFDDREVFADMDVAHRNFRVLHWAERPSGNCLFFEYDGGRLFLKDRDDPACSREVMYAHFQKKQLENNGVTDHGQFAVTPKGLAASAQETDGMFYERSVKAGWYLCFRIRRYLKNRICVSGMRREIERTEK